MVLRDTAWHQLTFTFTAASGAQSDTGAYISLPTSGSMSAQVTGASVTPYVKTGPPAATTPATTVLSFNGAAGTAPSTNDWTYGVGGGGFGNGQLESDTTSLRNASVDGNGHLLITARREQTTGPDGITRNYSSAQLSTKNHHDVQPGSYVETSISAPTGTGVWPAFWTVGSNLSSVGWPESGEIDIFEGSGAEPTEAHNALHMSAASSPAMDDGYGWGDAGGIIDLGESLDAEAHLYGVFFDANTVQFYVDRVLVRTLYASDARAAGKTWPFNLPQDVTLNVAVANSTPDSTPFPVTMTVGAVSIWQNGVPFGQGAGTPPTAAAPTTTPAPAPTTTTPAPAPTTTKSTPAPAISTPAGAAPVPPTAVAPAPPTTTAPVSPSSAATLMLSYSAQRAGAQILNRQSIGQNAFIYYPAVAGVTEVAFALDGKPYHNEFSAPWDLAGTGATGANAFQPSMLTSGAHTLAATVTMSNHSTLAYQATFYVPSSVGKAKVVIATTKLMAVSTALTGPSTVKLNGATIKGRKFILVSTVNGTVQAVYRLDNKIVHAYRVKNNPLAVRAALRIAHLSRGRHLLQVKMVDSLGAVSVANASFRVA